MNKYVSLLLFVLFVMGCGIAIGTLTAPGLWYAALEKPSFNPPNWIFAPVWTLLYLMIAYVGWRVWHMGLSTGLKRLWGLQMGLNFLWSPVFFAAQMPVLALFVIGCLLVALLAFVKEAWHSDRLSAVMFLPYVAWVSFATALNAAIVILN
ncbi:TspO/MBR family protein [Shimia thalassica]|uniref:TspO/MBR family protein n=1 Tax=Shimia thalassica TaxID=1715693 RepID=UPI002735935A|nr:TspO/MBR family protein [Shimia thalassica]MDP2520095.1 TspO/MBR family protein [Shimia thalassica]